MTNGDKIKNFLVDHSMPIIAWLLTLSFTTGMIYMQFITHKDNRDLHWTTLERMQIFLPRQEHDDFALKITEQFGEVRGSNIRIENKLDRVIERNYTVDSAQGGAQTSKSDKVGFGAP